MKKIALITLLVTLLALSATALEVSSPVFGDDRQDRVSGVSTAITIKNNDTSNLTNLQLSFTDGAEQPKFQLGFVSAPPTSLDAGETTTVTLNGTIPLDHDAVDSKFKEASLKIGSLVVTGEVSGQQVSQTRDIKMQAVNQLEINRVRVRCDTKTKTVDDGDEVENLRPGEDCTFEIEIENNFDDDDRDDKRIGDVEFTSISVDVESGDSDVDIDLDDEPNDLDANDEDIVTGDIVIEDDASDGSIDIDIIVEARDENGALHGEALEFRMEVDRLTHDLVIRRVDLSPTRVQACRDTTAKLTVNVLNQGKRDEDETTVEASAPDLGYTEKSGLFSLDEDDSTSVTFTVPVPEETRPGVYRVDVETFFDEVAPSNSASVELTVDECERDQEEEQESQQPDEDRQTTVTVPQTQPNQPVIPSGTQAVAAPRQSSDSFTDSKAYLALLAVLTVVIAIAIAVMIATLVKKRQ